MPERGNNPDNGGRVDAEMGGYHFFYYFTVKLHLLCVCVCVCVCACVSVRVRVGVGWGEAEVKFALLHFDSSVFSVNHARLSSMSL